MAVPEGEVSRRQFLVSSALVAGYALAAGPVLAQAIHTDEDGVETGTVAIPVEAGSVPAYVAAPAAAQGAPVVLVVHEIFGVHEYIRDVCRRLAKAGYFAIAPDLYQRQGDVSKLADAASILSEVVSRVPDDQVTSDLDAALAWAAKDDRADATRAAITGFCWGGRIVWLYCAHRPDLKAGVAWYGRLTGEKRPTTPTQPIDLASAKQAPVLGLYGTEDAGIPLESVEAMQEALATAGQASEIVLFPGAPHGFHADYRASYRSLAAMEGWRRMLEWFRVHGADPAAS